jgi:hypothetical protein
LPSWIWIRILNADPDPATQINADPDPQPCLPLGIPGAQEVFVQPGCHGGHLLPPAHQLRGGPRVQGLPRALELKAEHRAGNTLRGKQTGRLCYVETRVADPDPGSGIGKKSGSGIRIRDKQPGTYFRELRKQLFGLKYLNSLMWIWDPGWKNSDPRWKIIGSGIRDKHPGSATLFKTFTDDLGRGNIRIHCPQESPADLSRGTRRRGRRRRRGGRRRPAASASGRGPPPWRGWAGRRRTRSQPG